MKKLFATALMAMSMGSVFAQDNIGYYKELSCKRLPEIIGCPHF